MIIIQQIEQLLNVNHLRNGHTLCRFSTNVSILKSNLLKNRTVKTVSFTTHDLNKIKKNVMCSYSFISIDLLLCTNEHLMSHNAFVSSKLKKVKCFGIF